MDKQFKGKSLEAAFEAQKKRDAKVAPYEVSNEELRRKAVIRLENFNDRKPVYNVEIFSEGWAMRKKGGLSIADVTNFLGVHEIIHREQQVVALEQWHKRVITGRDRYQQALNDLQEKEKIETPVRHLRPSPDMVREVHRIVRQQDFDREIRKQMDVSENQDQGRGESLKGSWGDSGGKGKKQGRSW